MRLPGHSRYPRKEEHDRFSREHFPQHAESIWALVEERMRQEVLFPGKWALPDSQFMRFKRLAILTEEVGEVARAILEEDEDNLTEEITQVAAVAVAWLEARKRRP